MPNPKHFVMNYMADDPLWCAKWMYTITSFSSSAILNYLPIYFQSSLKLSKSQIGILQALPCLCAFVAPPFWGIIVDALPTHRRAIHRYCILSGALFMYSLSYIRSSFGWASLLLLAANVHSAATISLLDQAVMDLVVHFGGEYGQQRLFGALGYGSGAYITGSIVARGGLQWAFHLHLITAMISAVSLAIFPQIASAPTSEFTRQKTLLNSEFPNTPSQLQLQLDGSSEQRPLLEDSWRHSTEVSNTQQSLLTEPGQPQLQVQADLVMLLGVTFITGGMFGVISSFLTLNLFNLAHGNAHIIGLAIACNTLSELPAFFFSHRIIAHLGIAQVLGLSILAYGIRISIYAVMVNPWYVIPVEFLHGITFGLAWAASTTYIYHAAPGPVQGLSMGLLPAIQNGLGRGVGTLVGGYLYDHYGASYMWSCADIGVPVALLGVLGFAQCIKPTTVVLPHQTS